jgi:uncharacterized membrane protein
VLGGAVGLGCGAALLNGSPARLRLWALVGTVAMVGLLNFAPTNPYLSDSLPAAQLRRMWGLGNTIAMVSCLWPIGALLLLLVAPRRPLSS